jgi:phosphoesterase RecJ-like protein
MLEQTGASWEDTENLVDYMRRVRGVQVSLCLKEEQSGRTKLSLRSWGEVDVRAIAAELGGGGHANAAGGILFEDLDRARDRVIRQIARHLDRPLPGTSPEDPPSDTRWSRP